MKRNITENLKDSTRRKWMENDKALEKIKEMKKTVMIIKELSAYNI